MEEQRIEVTGIEQPIEIVVDKWGIPHIRAGSNRDLFFAQGFNAARDRLWQLDLWRKRGLGLLARDFGPGYVAQDGASRLFIYRGDMDAEWAVYAPDARLICEDFVRGINAYVDLIERYPHWMPPEFIEIGTRPDKWEAADVVRIRVHSWMRNALSEGVRANVLAGADAEVDLLRQNLSHGKRPVVADGIDLATIPIEVLDIYKLALTPVSFGKDRLAAKADDAASWTKLTPLGEVIRDTNASGSNNWVIAGDRTESGRPIMANDPHRAHAIPSLRYIVHLTSPEFDGIGAGEPVLPGIMIGHNGTIAFGLTLFFGPDEEDIYVYETEPGNPNRYRYGDGFEDMTVITEEVPVKGGDVEDVILKYTRHGPVIREEPDNHRAYAVRSVWFEPGASPYAVSLSAMRRKNFTDFKADMERWSVPAVNMVYADTSGDIAWIVAAQSPIRPNWDGLTPVPGDGRYEWAGFYTAKELPHMLNPIEGFFATANEMNLPADWPHEELQVGYEWYDRARATRLAETFAATPVHSVATSQAMQTDIVSMPARRAVALLAPLSSKEQTESKALAMLRGFDGVISSDSPAAALFEVWWSKHLRPNLFARATPDSKIRALLAPGDADGVLDALETPGHWFGPDPKQSRDELLLSTLVAAWRECADLMGEDGAAWQWGKLHHGYFAHALTTIGVSPEGMAMDVGPLPIAGSDATPMNTMYRFSDFRVVLGASFRIVVDVGGWDNSVCINAPGQSGDPRSPHYGDLALMWSLGEYVPMSYSREAVDKVAEKIITLLPA
ncbi:penicillin acylase family protein [Bauldia litoralis]|uniref:Penicillin amidase n=1 Tax=Bauldia litoralis TaxID=665467 RepID=A0A1G6EM41_9HYPH|nr:penicillin acylase family protein [Bauldia litoralis]SDB58454.1 penicillin amidase [Bauldia litoralis]